MTGDLVLAEHRGPALVLSFNRPHRLNAWNDELEDQYFDLLARADADPEVRAIVVTGTGRGFCSGADMADLADIGEGGGAPPPRPLPRSFPLTVRKPMIAAINGPAAGLGLVEALYCDIRFATPEAKLITAFSRLGLVAEYGIAWLLPRLIGQSRALDLLLSSRIVTGSEALSLGLVDRVVDADALVAEAVAYAVDLAEHCSPWSMSVIKAQVREALESDFASTTAEADRLMLESFAGPDITEGVLSHQERRPPRFPPLPPRQDRP
jgi:enoyl-CoA hydratase/carnithine racemase